MGKLHSEKESSENRFFDLLADDFESAPEVKKYIADMIEQERSSYEKMSSDLKRYLTTKNIQIEEQEEISRELLQKYKKALGEIEELVQEKMISNQDHFEVKMRLQDLEQSQLIFGSVWHAVPV